MDQNLYIKYLKIIKAVYFATDIEANKMVSCLSIYSLISTTLKLAECHPHSPLKIAEAVKMSYENLFQFKKKATRHIHHINNFYFKNERVPLDRGQKLKIWTVFLSTV